MIKLEASFFGDSSLTDRKKKKHITTNGGYLSKIISMFCNCNM